MLLRVVSFLLSGAVVCPLALHSLSVPLHAQIQVEEKAPNVVPIGRPTYAASPASVNTAGAPAVEPRAPFYTAAPRGMARAQYGRLPIRFEPNRGQASPETQFISHGNGYATELTSDSAVLSLRAGQRAAQLRLVWVGANRSARVEGVDPLPTVSNYLIGRREDWRTGIRNYARVRYKSLYAGVDLEFYGAGYALEYDLIAAPGADLRRLRFRVEGARSATIDADGDLVIAVAGGTVVQHRPVLYQATARGRRQVEGRYRMLSRNEVGFQIGSYDRRESLTIDPVLSYATYFGGSFTDGAAGIAVDSVGSAYVVGTTNSPDFPVRNAVLSTIPSSTYSYAFILKLNAIGDDVVYATYLGGGRGADGIAIAVDSAGSAYMLGRTRSADFPTVNAYQSRFSGSHDAVIAKLTPDGRSLSYSTYLGGSGEEWPHAITVDAAANAYIAGTTESDDFPAPNGVQRSRTGATNGFVVKLNASGKSLGFGSFIGGKASTDCSAVALDAAGNIYLGGFTIAPDFPNAVGQMGGFVVKLNPAGSQFLYTNVFGPYTTHVNGIAVDGAGSAYITGMTTSSWQTTRGSVQTTFGGRDYDAFVAKLDPAGSSFLYSTFLGGSSDDAGYAIAVDTAGNAYVAGDTTSSDFPVASAVQKSSGGGSDVFVTKLNPSGSALLYSTYFGGARSETVPSLAIDASGSAYIAGTTNSSDLTTLHAVQSSLAGESNVLVAKILDAGGNGGCTYSLNTAALSVSADGGSGSITLSAPVGCAWQAASNVSWITLTSASGSGSSSVSYTVAPNTSTVARTGVITMAGQSVTVTQAGTSGAGNTQPATLAPDASAAFSLPAVTTASLFTGRYEYRISVPQPATQLALDFAATGGNVNMYVRYGEPVVTSNGAVVSDYVAKGTNGAGHLVIDAGSNPPLRGGDYYVAFASFTVGTAIQGSITTRMQVAQTCTVTLPGYSLSVPRIGGTVVVDVTAASGCAWQSSSSVPWVTALMPAKNTAGTNTVSLLIAPNGTASQRNAAITIGGQTLTITQAAGINFGTAKTINAGETVSATLTPSSARSIEYPDTYADLYQFTLSAPQQVTIRMGSSQFETYLVVYDAAGVVVAEEDQAPGGDAVVAGTFPAGTYRFEATSLDSATSGAYSLSLGLQAQGSVPVISAQGVVHAGTFQSGAVAAGEIITIFGQNLGPADLAGLQVNSSGRVANTLAGTRVWIAGFSAPLVYAQANQVAAIVPFNIDGLGHAQVQVEYNGVRSNFVQMPFDSARPGLFTTDGHQAAALNQNGSVNSPANPEQRGRVVVLYGTGAGETTPAGTDGRIATTSLPKPKLPVKVEIGGVPAEVLYAATAPSMVEGVIQLNVKIPASVTPGPSVPVSVTVGQATSPAMATIAVQ